MNTINKLDGQLFEKLIIGGAINLKANVKEVNELNVFPIPDGPVNNIPILLYIINDECRILFE